MERYHEDRPWGHFDQFIKDEPCTVKIISVNKGESLSLQYHERRAEYWYVIEGNPKVTIDDNITDLRGGDECTIPKGSKHRLEAPYDDIRILEIATGDFDENDIVRLEDKYNRV